MTTVIARAPFRVSFVGGGTDVPAFFESYGPGCTLTSAIAKYVYIVGTSRFGGRGYSLRYSRGEDVATIDQIRHPIIRETLAYFDIDNIELSVVAQIPAGTGLGSSSAFTNALVLVCSRLAGQELSQLEVAEISCEIEIQRLGEPIGMQDQYASAVGGIQKLMFSRDGVTASELDWRPEIRHQFESRLKLVHIGLPTRNASELLRNQFDKAALDFGTRVQALSELSQLAQRIADLSKENPFAIGEALGRSWELKKKSNPKARNVEIDKIFAEGLSLGANSAKLLGAGGSGFALFWSDTGFPREFTGHFLDKGLVVLDYKLDRRGAVVLEHV